MMDYLNYKGCIVLTVLIIFILCIAMCIGTPDTSTVTETINIATTAAPQSVEKTSVEVPSTKPAVTASKETTARSKVLKNIPILFPEIQYKIAYNTEFYDKLLADTEVSLERLELAIASNEYSNEACELMNQEVIRLETIITKAIAAISTIWHWEDECYYAIKTWDFFIQRGYSNVIVGAILGNMMIETSGGTLQLKPTIYNSTGDYYGLCQWSLYYKPELDGITFEEQLEYLDTDMAYEFNTFGDLYYSGFTYEDFLAMDDPAEAALAFAKVYERCGSASYNKRQVAAETAFEYFTF